MGTTASILAITTNPNRYTAFGPDKALKGDNDEFERLRFAGNIVPFDECNPFGESGCSC
jgi:hypothetical protein